MWVAIGRRLRRRACDLGWTQAEVARRSRLHVETVRRVYTGRGPFTTDTLDAMADALGVRMQDAIAGRDAQHEPAEGPDAW